MPVKPVVYQVVKGGAGWRLVREGSQRATAITGTKESAIRKAKDLSLRYGAIIKVHSANGALAETFRVTKTKIHYQGSRGGIKAAKKTAAAAGEFVHDILPPPTKPRKKA